MTQIEQRFYNLAANFFAAKSSKTIDWEQRRYELVKDLYAAKIGRSANYKSEKELMDEAFKEADIIIKRLQEEKWNKN